MITAINDKKTKNENKNHNNTVNYHVGNYIFQQGNFDHSMKHYSLEDSSLPELELTFATAVVLLLLSGIGHEV